MKSIGIFFRKNWIYFVIALGVLIVSYLLLFRGISAFVDSRYTVAETTSAQGTTSLVAIRDNPVIAPFKLTVYGLNQLFDNSVLTSRVVAAMTATTFACLFYWIVGHWFSRRVAIFSTIAFVASALFLHVARYGDPLIAQMAPLLLIAGLFYYQRVRNTTLAAYILTIILGLALYSPGMIWFAIIGIAVVWPSIVRFVREHGALHSSIMGVVLLAVIAPALWASSQNTALITEFAGIPATVPSLSDISTNAKVLGEALVYRSYYSPAFMLHGAPVLNIAEITLLIGGVIALAIRPRLRGNYFILGGLIIATILVLLGGGPTLSMLAPFVYLSIAAGIFYILEQWFVVFPRNPFARTVGVILFSLVIAFSALYHLRAYYVAWPNAPETKQVYTVNKS